jgi:hypothetical protein
MRTFLIGSITFCSLFLASCSQKDAQEYAKQLAALLDKYSAQIDAKLADEQMRYVNEARRLEQEGEVDEQQRLKDLRTSEAKQFAADLKKGRTKPAAILSILAGYAKTDFASNRDVYEKSQDAYLEHMKGLTNLTLEKAKIQGLTQALKALAKDPEFLAQAEDAVKFGTDLKDGINLNTCNAASKAKAKADALVKSLTSAIAAPGATETERAANEAKMETAKADSAAAAKLAKSTGRLNDEGTACK